MSQLLTTHTDDNERPSKRMRLDTMVVYQNYHLIPIDIICHIIMPMLQNEHLHAYLFVNRACRQKALQLVEQHGHDIFKSLIQQFHGMMEYDIAYKEAYYKKVPCNVKDPFTGWGFYCPYYNNKSNENDGSSQFEDEIHFYTGPGRVYMPKKDHNPSKTHSIPTEVLLRIQPELNDYTISSEMSMFYDNHHWPDNQNSYHHDDIEQFGFDHALDWIPICRYITKECEDVSLHSLCWFNKPWVFTLQPPDRYKNNEKVRHYIDRIINKSNVLVFVCCRKDSPFYGRLAFCLERMQFKPCLHSFQIFYMPSEEQTNTRQLSLDKYDHTRTPITIAELFLEHLIEQYQKYEEHVQ